MLRFDQGLVELGEDDLQTAFRETEEEAGLACGALRLVEGFQRV